MPLDDWVWVSLWLKPTACGSTALGWTRLFLGESFAHCPRTHTFDGEFSCFADKHAHVLLTVARGRASTDGCERAPACEVCSQHISVISGTMRPHFVGTSSLILFVVTWSVALHISGFAREVLVSRGKRRKAPLAGACAASEFGPGRGHLAELCPYMCTTQRHLLLEFSSSILAYRPQPLAQVCFKHGRRRRPW